MNENVIIIGASGHGKVIADIVRGCGDCVFGFLDDDKEKVGKSFYGAAVLGTGVAYAAYADECSFIIAIGNNAIRRRLAESMRCRWYTAIHPTAVLSASAMLGEGSCVMANAVINADAAVGAHTIINTGAVVEHDCHIGCFSHLSPHATVCGLASVGDGTWLGAGSTVINCLSVCADVMVGAGATVVKSIDAPGTYVGVPARRIDG